MWTTTLHDDFGVEVHAVNLCTVTAENLYSEIRDLFEQYSLLLFRGQDLDESQHRALAALFGPLEDLRDKEEGVPQPRSMVSNVVQEGELAEESDLQLLDLKSNFIWHTDSTFLPTPAISNILVGYKIPSTGGNTEFVSTRIGWERMSSELKERARDQVLLHRFAHSRKQVDDELAELELYTKFPDTPWRTTWRNPVNGTESLYIAAHAYGVRDLPVDDGVKLIDDLMAAVTGPEAIYTHKWQVGDVLIWDQRATLHRGTAWPYHEERTLGSFVSSAVESDGIASARP
jgi:alpha-ketoglutarate-dependent 2,4-dichlorophenoxyacetate dioxygenase